MSDQARPRYLICFQRCPRQLRNQSRHCIDVKGYLPMPEPFPIATMDAFAPEFLAALPRRRVHGLLASTRVSTNH